MTEKIKEIYKEITAEAEKLCGEREHCRGCQYFDMNYDCVVLTAAKMLETACKDIELLKAENVSIRQTSVTHEAIKLLVELTLKKYKTAVKTAITGLKTDNDSNGLKQNSTIDKVLQEVEKIEVKI